MQDICKGRPCNLIHSSKILQITASEITMVFNLIALCWTGIHGTIAKMC